MRIRSIDWLRGMAIGVMLFIHTQNNWLTSETAWLRGISYIIGIGLEVNAFIFVAGLSFGFSWGKDRTKGLSPSDRRQRSLSRTIVILGFSMGYNIFACLVHNYGWQNLWYWYILQLIGILRLLGLLIIEWKPWARICFVGLNIGLGVYLYHFLDILRAENLFWNVIYFILFNPIHANSPVFFLPFFVIGTIFGEQINTLSEISTPNDTLPRRFDSKIIKIWGFWACGLMLGGILLGLTPSSKEIGWDFIPMLQTHPTLNITALPGFILINTLPWSLFTMGLIIFILTVLFWRLDVPTITADHLLCSVKDPGGKGIATINLFELFGRYSLTIYLTHYVFFTIPLQVDFTLIWPLELWIFSSMYLAVYSIDRYSHGRISIENAIEFGAVNILKKWKQ